MEADKEVLPYSYKIEGVNNIKGPKEEEREVVVTTASSQMH